MAGHRRLVFSLAVTLLLATLGTSGAAPNAPQSTMAATGAVAARQAGEQTGLRDGLGPMTIYEMEGYGCLASGAAATALTALAGTNELILVFGGTITPTTPIGLGVAMAGTIFASFCAIGALATPAVARLWRYYTISMPPATP